MIKRGFGLIHWIKLIFPYSKCAQCIEKMVLPTLQMPQHSAVAVNAIPAAAAAVADADAAAAV